LYRRFVEHWQPVEFVGPDDLDARIYEGHPGRVIDLGQYPSEVSVGFVNGPSWCLPPDRLRPLSEAKYLERGRRLVALTHPLRDAAIPRFNAEGHEWIDGKEPAAP
jgi:hypothetical protein